MQSPTSPPQRPEPPRARVRALLLARRGVAFVSSHGPPLPDDTVRAVELELAALGYVASTRLRERLRTASLDELGAFRAWAVGVLAAHRGAGQKHVPLFRSFPAGVPDDTAALWWKKVLVHFVQAEDQPCLFCHRAGTTHVLDPCRHVVCDRCWDGTSYSACPVCEHHVDPRSPFFRPAPERGLPSEKVTKLRFDLIDLGADEEDEARALFVSLCERKQALSPDDRGALVAILEAHGAGALAWLPATIPVRENVAIVFGTLFSTCAADVVLPVARRYMTTATDVLRFIAVRSGTDGSLQPEEIWKTLRREVPQERRFWDKVAALLGVSATDPHPQTVYAPMQVRRFKVAKLGRPLRRALLAILDGLDPDRLVEDMLRHRSYWVWVGEFLHPGEYAERFPHVARAFTIVRKKAPDGTEAPAYHGFYSRLEAAIARRDAGAMMTLLAERPGELARRFDLLLRIAEECGVVPRVVDTFSAHVGAFATPVLLTLRSHLPQRASKAPVRVYWPKGRVVLGVSAPDRRAPIDRGTIEPALGAIDAELLLRFAAKPALATAIVDQALRTILVPFNERTASPAAIALPRGSRVSLPLDRGRILRLFLHWCEPEKGGEASDLDLSVTFYDDAWNHVGVCSYYNHQLVASGGALVAQSAGDLRDAPWPDGATELVDLHQEAARAAGFRYAVMVVNNYAGMPFSQLERGFAGLMLRDDAEGAYFDPRTVELKFSIGGDNGVFLPLVVDLRERVLHWLDVQAKGQLELNNVATSNTAITKVCPALMAYFGSGVRPSMYELALLHAAARCGRVYVRGDAGARLFVRRPSEGVNAFHARLLRDEADEPRAPLPPADGPPLLAALYRGDIDLPADSTAWALLRDRVTPTLAASDLLS